MLEQSIDLTGVRPQRLTTELAEQADVIVTMGCGYACPVTRRAAPRLGGSRTSKGQSPEAASELRHEIGRRVDQLVSEFRCRGAWLAVLPDQLVEALGST